MLKKILFIIFLIFISFQFLNSCTKPFETDSTQTVKKTELIYDARIQNAEINEFALSNSKEQFAILRNNQALNLYNAESNISFTDTLIKLDALNINYVRYETQLSLGGNKVSYIYNNKIYILEIQSGKIDSIPFPDNRKFESFNWANSESSVLYISQNSMGDSSWIYLLDLNSNNYSMTYYGDLRVNRASMDHGNNILYFSARYNSLANYNIYFKELNQNILDSIVLDESYIYTLSVSNNGEQICYNPNNKLKVYNLLSNSVVKEINTSTYKYLTWSPDDSKILMPGSGYYYILTLYNNDLSSYRINAGSIYGWNAVWDTVGKKILFLAMENSQAIDIINTQSVNVQSSFNLPYGSDNISWDFDDKSIYYKKQKNIFQLTIQTGNQDTLPFHVDYSSFGKCSFDGKWLAIQFGSTNYSDGFLFFNKQTNEYYEIVIEDFNDFEWIKNSYQLCTSLHRERGINIYNWEEPDLKLEKSIDSGKYYRMKWAPVTSEILDTFGDYIAYYGNSGLGIFMVETGSQLEMNFGGPYYVIEDFDWSADGRSLYLLGNSRIYKEQIFYEK